MEQPSRRRDEPECSVKEWSRRSQISRDNTRSRRFSGYSLNGEIDPSTYSFTTALKALQTRSKYVNTSWECLSSEGFVLNSKWNDAEKYICNPLSGEVPMECLSSKTLIEKSFQYNSELFSIRYTKSPNPNPKHVSWTHFSKVRGCDGGPREDDVATREEEDVDIIDDVHLPVTKGNIMEGTTKDVGIQSTPTHELSSGRSSPIISTPSIIERSFKRCEILSSEGEDDDSPIEVINFKEIKVKGKETGKKVEERKQSCDKEDNIMTNHNEQVKRWSSKRKQGNGCLFWIRKRGKDKHLLRNENKTSP